MRRVPAELLGMMFNATIRATKRKEEKRLQMACQVFDMDDPVVVKDVTVNGMPPSAESGPYGSSSGIMLPSISSKAAQGMRRRGISPKNDYIRVRAQVTPQYTIDRFVDDLRRGANFKPK